METKQLNDQIITLDIETAPRVGLFFGNTYKASIAKTIQESYVFGFSWKPLGKKVRSCYIWDFPLYKKEPRNDIEVVKKYIEVVSAAEVVVGQNSRSFDDKVMMGRVIVHHLPAPTPFKTVDTKTDVQRVARYDSNKLDDVSKQYGFGGKADTGGIELWWDCMQGITKAQKKMVRYCERDVILTEKKYLWERPYYKNHPSMNLIVGQSDACPYCGKVAGFTRHGHYFTKTSEYIVWKCNNCHAHPRSRTSVNTVKARFV